MSATRVYEAAKHRFYDDIFNITVAMIGYGVASQVHRGVAVNFNDGRRTIFRGRPTVSGIDMFIDAKDLYGPLEHNTRPSQIEFVTEEPEPFIGSPEEPRLILGPIIQTGFVHYYESVKDAIEGRRGGDSSKWPDVLRFGRVVRNAFTHDGKVDIRNPKADPVKWRGLTYSYSDNGREILYVDLLPADVFVLMEEMDREF